MNGEWNTIILSIGGVLTTIITTVGAVFLAKINATVKEVHVAVNSERSAMIAEVKVLRDEILKMTTRAIKLAQINKKRK